ncbi:MAG: FKBP-type peptidyl-prolyl cis-trans isomerase [Acidobacteriia bacterium]|nr:FKBP-type peptidyl-prolyl cis-trans isomerase [Terriglobia bacterium]
MGKREVIAGLEYGIEGMRVGGVRKISVSPHLAYRDTGVADKIPGNAKLTNQCISMRTYGIIGHGQKRCPQIGS